MSAKYKPLDIAWASLGINYVIPEAKWDPRQDPEELIIQSLPEFFEDPRLLSMFLAWAEEYDELINVPRLEAYIKELEAFDLSILGAIAQKLSVNGRWARVKNKVVKKIGKNRPRFQERAKYVKLAKVSGRDHDFDGFGISIPTVSKSDPKKLKPKDVIAQHNYWFKLRMLIDNHMRADVAVAIYILNVKNAYQVAKRLKCSIETAYRQFNSLKDPIVAKQIEAIIKDAAA
jgi:hypothetical protein